mgnify:CR=1 FL=1
MACRLYLISPERLDHPSIFADELRGALDGGDVAAFQLRLKDVADEAIARVTDTLRPVCQQRGVAFILNDRPDLAAKIDADGVHVGQEDASYADARAAMGKNRIVGVTCHDSRHLAIEASEAGADYVAFGAFYPSTTKDVTNLLSPDILAWWSEMMELPSCAIGGITPENAEPLIAAGADAVAVISALYAEPDITAAARKFCQLFEATPS